MAKNELLSKRAALVGEFAIRIRAALWEGIEAADPQLLAADDGSLYSVPSVASDSFGKRSEIERMVDAAANAAANELRNWL